MNNLKEFFEEIGEWKETTFIHETCGNPKEELIVEINRELYHVMERCSHCEVKFSNEEAFHDAEDELGEAHICFMNGGHKLNAKNITFGEHDYVSIDKISIVCEICGLICENHEALAWQYPPDITILGR